MDKLFFGFLLIFINFNLTIKGHTLNILPDWAGYCLIYSGLNDLSDKGEHFPLAKPWCLGMAVYTGAVWLLEIFMGDTKLGIISWVLNIVATLVSFYVSYLILQGIIIFPVPVAQRKHRNACSEIQILFSVCILKIHPFP